jgi:glucose-1-phosphate thymidylyltransferase
MQAIIVAAGRGERLRPVTNDIPKAMAEVNGKPMLQILLEQLKTVGVTEVIMIVHYMKEKIEQKFGTEFKGIKIKYAFQPELRGDGHAVMYAEPYIKQDKFITIFCDSLFPTEHLPKLLQHDSDGVMTSCQVDYEMAKRMGVLFVEDKKVTKIIEKPAEPPSTLVNTSIHYLPKEIFEAGRHISKEKKMYRVVDMIQHLIDQGKKFHHETVTQWLDIGTLEQLEEAQELAKKIL